MDILVNKRIFCTEPTMEMITWFYADGATKDIFYDPIDDRTGVVTIVEEFTERSITIGLSQKREIIHSFLFYHPDKYADFQQAYN
jgi:hypothetical protein